MPIVITLDVMLAKRKMSLKELSETIGLTPSQVSILKTEKVQSVRLSTLDAICETLECQPGDLLMWINQKDYKKLKRL